MGWMVWGLNSGGDKRFFSSPQCEDRLCGPPSLLFMRTWVVSPLCCTKVMDEMWNVRGLLEKYLTVFFYANT